MKDIVSVVLLFKDRDNAAIETLSKQIPGNKIQLGKNALPHITIAQFKADKSSLDTLFSELKDISVGISSVQTDGINFVPTGYGDTWIELVVLKSEKLRELHEAVLKTAYAEQYELHSGAYDRYRPHTTVGLVDGVKGVPEIVIEDAVQACRGEYKVKVAVGVNGSNFTFTQNHKEL